MPPTDMRPQKKTKTLATINSRLAHDLLVQTQMCQSAIKDLKELMKKSGIRKETPSYSKSKINRSTLIANTKVDNEVVSNNNNKGCCKKANPSVYIQNGLHYTLEVHTAEPISVLERLCRIGEEVEEVLRTSKSFGVSINSEQHRKRDRDFSSDDVDQDHCQVLHEIAQNSHLDAQVEGPQGIPCIEIRDDELGRGSLGLSNPCVSDGVKHGEKHNTQGISTNSQEHAEQDEPLEHHTLNEANGQDDSESDDDGLKSFWIEADFYRKCTQEQGEQKDITAEKGCNHNFVLKGDVGLVCDACGLVGKDIETIFNFTWGNEPRSQESRRRESNKPGAFEIKDAEGKEVAVPEKPIDEQMHQNLVVDPHHRTEMHEHQIDGFNFLEENIVEGEHGGCILAHAPGTGKTFLIIVFLHSFLQAYPEKRVMILAPKGMLLPWVKEFKKWKVDIPLLNLYESSSSSWQPSMDPNDYGVETHDTNTGDQLKVYQLQRVKEWQMTKSILLVSYPHFSYLVNHESGNALTMETKRLLLEVPGLLILDEGHTSRTSDTIILKSLTHVRTKKRIMLSGTLFQNNFKELYNLCKLVRPSFMHEKSEILKAFLEPILDVQGNRMQKLFDVKSNDKRQPADVIEQRMFVDCLGEKIDTGSVEERSEALKVLHELMAPFVHWHKGRILEALPGLTDFTIFLNLTSAQEAVFASLESQALKMMEKEKRCALANVHPSLLKTKINSKQASQSKEYYDCNADKTDQNANIPDNDSWSITNECDPAHGSKAKFVIDMVALCYQLQEKVIIFSQYLPPLSLLQKLFNKLWGWFENQQMLRLDGDVSPENRERIINRFNKNKESRVLLASIKACGEGVSLVGASRVIFLDVNWNPAVTQQAISRAFRIGQNKKVFAYRLVGIGTLDEEIERAASRKEWLATVISRAGSNAHFESSSKEVDPQLEDRLFDSVDLKKLVAKCYLKEHF